MEQTLDVVYYTGPVPSSWQTLATLALVFDNIHFPGVYMCTEGLDEAATVREFERIRSASLGRMDADDLHLLNCILVASQHQYLKDFCVFPGSFGTCGTLEPGAQELVMKLEELYFGPPPPGFHPTPKLGFAKGLPGSAKAGINAPGWLSYPANAFLYAARRGLPYLNDDPSMPMLAVPGVTAKNNVKMLSAVLAVESVRLILPSLRPLTAPQIQELRERTRDDVKPFRRAMLKLTKSVNDALGSDATMDEVTSAARFVAQTEVEPELEDLRKMFRDSARPWIQRLVDFAGPATVLVSGASSLPVLVAKVLAGLLVPLGAEAAAQRTRTQTVKRSGLHFLLKLEGT